MFPKIRVAKTTKDCTDCYNQDRMRDEYKKYCDISCIIPLAQYEQTNSSTPKVPIPPLRKPGQQQQQRHPPQLPQVLVLPSANQGSNVLFIGPMLPSAASKPRWALLLLFYFLTIPGGGGLPHHQTCHSYWFYQYTQIFNP